MIGAVGLAALIGIIAAIPPSASQGGAAVNLLGPADVNVVNSPAVSITGNPSFRLDATAGPIRVRDVVFESRTPIQIRVRVSVDAFGIGVQSVHTVPAGKRLAIQHIALKTPLLENGTSLHADVLIGPVASEFDHPLTPAVQHRFDFTHYIANHALLAFAEAGTEVRVRAILVPCFAEGREGLVALQALSGYLEDAP